MHIEEKRQLLWLLLTVLCTVAIFLAQILPNDFLGYLLLAVLLGATIAVAVLL